MLSATLRGTLQRSAKHIASLSPGGTPLVLRGALSHGAVDVIDSASLTTTTARNHSHSLAPNRPAAFLHNNNNNNIHVCSFHSTVAVRNDNDEEGGGGSAKDTLLDLLKREYDEEQLNSSTELPPDLKELQETVSKTWKIVHEGGMTKLVRTLTDQSNLKVQISFHCQDVVEDDEGFDDEMLGQGEEPAEAEDEDDEASHPIKFTIAATKAGQTMLFSCFSEHAVAIVKSVALTQSDNIDSLLTNGSVPPSNYQGPIFEELAQDLQLAFQDYVETELGVDEDVASFIAMYADYKEQEEYVKFLEQSQRILS